MSRVVAIAGMGWLGLPLAQRLQLLGYKVKGSVTRLEKANDLQQKGFDVYAMTVTEDGIHGSIANLLSQVEVLVIMIPPGLRNNTGSDFVLKMTYFLEAVKLADVPKVILVSSTSVYGDAQGKVTEKDPPIPETQVGKQLLQVEQLFFNSGISTSIVRFGGLYGGSRQPVRYLAGRSELRGGNSPINLVHRDDCLQILSEIIKKDAFGQIFNAVMPTHQKKRDYYQKMALELGLDPPHFTEESSSETYKQVDSINLKEVLEYQFRHSI